MKSTRLIDPHGVFEPRLNDLWNLEESCRVGTNIRICPTSNGTWTVIERHGDTLYQPDHPFDTFAHAHRSTIGKTLKEDPHGHSSTSRE